MTYQDPNQNAALPDSRYQQLADNEQMRRKQQQDFAREEGQTAYIVDTLGQKYQLVQFFDHEQQRWLFALEF